MCHIFKNTFTVSGAWELAKSRFSSSQRRVSLPWS